jgi:DNA-directed RNA polymerase specialized sigma subunit
VNTTKTGFEESYRDVRGTILSTCRKFKRMNPWAELDELISVANEAFVRCYHRYDPERGAAFNSWVQTKVFYALISWKRSESIHNWNERSMADYGGHEEDRQEGEPSFEEELFRAPEPEEFRDRLHDLSDDAWEVIRLMITDAMERIKDEDVNSLLAGVASGSARRAGIADALKSRNWSGKRIVKAFREIEGALR